MSTDDGQFIATGGDDIDDGNPNFGFYTDPSKDDDGGHMDYGVNVQGTICGVYAESLPTLNLMAERTTPGGAIGEQVGVYAIGQDRGVIGECRGSKGVEGISPSIGVQGTSKDVDDTHIGRQVGVLGLCIQKDKATDKLVPGSGVGVYGVSGTGIGVRGVILDKINPEVPLPDLGKTKPEEIGVQGFSTHGVGVQGGSQEKTGVSGTSGIGVGVSGESILNRGGVFQSGSIAQAQLIPAPLVDLLTSASLPFSDGDAKAGDLFSRLVVVSNQGGVKVVQAELWFCVQPTDLQPNDPILWAKVLLDTPVPPA